jgi:ubiquinone/menaquinone biosynthesis C-methylase UbiE
MSIKKEYYSRKDIVTKYDKFRFGGKTGQLISKKEISIIHKMTRSEKTGLKILDLPCGTGRSLEHHNTEDNNILFGADYSNEMLKFSSDKLKKLNIKFSRVDVFNLPFKQNSFDIITSIRFVSHYSDLKKILKSFKQILKKDGYLIFDTYLWSPRSIFSFNLGGKVFTHSPKLIKQIISEIGGLKITEFKSNFLFTPLVYRYLPEFINKFLFKIEKYFKPELLVRQYWKIQKYD